MFMRASMGLRELGRIYLCESAWNQGAERENAWKDVSQIPVSRPYALRKWGGEPGPKAASACVLDLWVPAAPRLKAGDAWGAEKVEPIGKTVNARPVAGRESLPEAARSNMEAVAIASSVVR